MPRGFMLVQQIKLAPKEADSCLFTAPSMGASVMGAGWRDKYAGCSSDPTVAPAVITWFIYPLPNVDGELMPPSV